MQRYILLRVKDGRSTASIPIVASHDVEAIETAWATAREGYCELWAGRRLVAFIERQN